MKLNRILGVVLGISLMIGCGGTPPDVESKQGALIPLGSFDRVFGTFQCVGMSPPRFSLSTQMYIETKQPGSGWPANVTHVVYFNDNKAAHPGVLASIWSSGIPMIPKGTNGDIQNDRTSAVSSAPDINGNVVGYELRIGQFVIYAGAGPLHYNFDMKLYPHVPYDPSQGRCATGSLTALTNL